MSLSITANTKGEVIIGLGSKVSVIVDDVFRKHHVFKLQKILERHLETKKSAESINGGNSESGGDSGSCAESAKPPTDSAPKESPIFPDESKSSDTPISLKSAQSGKTSKPVEPVKCVSPLFGITSIHCAKTIQRAESEKCGDSSSRTDSPRIGEPLWTVDALVCSRSSHHFACLTNMTYIVVWKRVMGSDKICDSWALTNIIGPVKKQISKFEFTHNDLNLIFCDIGGCVTSYDLISKESTILFNNISAITSMAVCYMGKYLATADTDLRIRISKFPQNFEIEQFCIGHTKNISHMLVTKHFLVSASEDGTVKCWDPKTAQIAIDIKLSDYFKSENVAITAMHHHCRNKRIVILIEGSITFFWFDYTKRNGLKKSFVCDLPMPLNIIASCWDFHGLFWAGTADKENPFILFFIDLEQACIYEVDEAQDHRYKAVKKHVFGVTTSPTKSTFCRTLSVGSDNESYKK